MNELIYKADARRVVLANCPAISHAIDRIQPVNAVIHKESYLEERIVDHEVPSYTVFECSICYAKNEQYHNYCCICGAKFKETRYVRNV